MNLPRKLAIWVLAAIATFCCWLTATGATGPPADDSTISSAICPIVYPVDQTPTARGYRYVFFGNAFFINKQGYLLTAAHVLSSFRNGGGQPHILVDRPMAPPQLLPAEVVAVDWEHDVAVLRATPNPFEGRFKVSFLPLTAEQLLPGKSVLAVALRPVKIQNPHTYELPAKESFTARVLNYQFTQEEKGAGDTELFLFSHEVLLGQSGAPVLSADSHEVVGLVDGRWLHPSAVSSGAIDEPMTPTLGAAVRIHYALALLQEKGITWQTAAGISGLVQDASAQTKNSSVPVPLSLVAAPFPSQSLSGGEVLLDALVNTSGKLEDIKVIKGESPFREKALSAMRTWTFLPARADGKPVEARIGVTFQFPQTFLAASSKRAREYGEPSANPLEHGPQPVATVEPDSLPNSAGEGSVILFDVVDEQGQITSTSEVYGVESLATPAESAAHQWRFAPGKHAGTETDSAAVAVFVFRRSVLPESAASAKKL
jgi:TonB family protein